MTSFDIPNLTQLIDRCKAGDEEAWAELVKMYGPFVFSVARSFRLSFADCDDVCQATWVRLFRHIDRLRDHSKARSWLGVIAAREALRLLQVSRRQSERASSYVEAPAEAAEQTVLNALEMDELREYVQALPLRSRRVLDMLLDNRTYSEIALAIGVSIDSVGSIRARSIAQLRLIVHAETAARQRRPASPTKLRKPRSHG